MSNTRSHGENIRGLPMRRDQEALIDRTRRPIVRTPTGEPRGSHFLFRTAGLWLPVWEPAAGGCGSPGYSGRTWCSFGARTGLLTWLTPTVPIWVRTSGSEGGSRTIAFAARSTVGDTTEPAVGVTRFHTGIWIGYPPKHGFIRIHVWSAT